MELNVNYQMPIVTITECPRCHKEHKNLVFNRLVSSILDYQYWCLCPELSEPILMIHYNEKD